MWRVVLTMLTLLACLALTAPALAQTTTNPTTVQFTPSADHAVMLGDVPVVTRYELRVTGGGTPYILDLGKPTPDAANTITIVNAPWFAALPKNVLFTAVVAAIGDGGEGLSDPSNPFANPGPPAKPGKPAPRK